MIAFPVGEIQMDWSLDVYAGSQLPFGQGFGGHALNLPAYRFKGTIWRQKHYAKSMWCLSFGYGTNCQALVPSGNTRLFARTGAGVVLNDVLNLNIALWAKMEYMQLANKLQAGIQGYACESAPRAITAFSA